MSRMSLRLNSEENSTLKKSSRFQPPKVCQSESQSIIFRHYFPWLGLDSFKSIFLITNLNLKSLTVWIQKSVKKSWKKWRILSMKKSATAWKNIAPNMILIRKWWDQFNWDHEIFITSLQQDFVSVERYQKYLQDWLAARDHQEIGKGSENQNQNGTQRQEKGKRFSSIKLAATLGKPAYFRS